MIVREVLGNGLTLVTEAMPHVRSVALGVWVKRGSRHEAPSLSGISHFIEHMVFKGTKSRSTQAIAAEVDSIGGHMDAFTAKEYAAFHLTVLDERLPLAADILGDIVMNPLFDPDEVTKEKKVIFEEINMVEDTPDDLVVELFTEAFWPDHPLGRPVLGTKASVGSLTRADLQSFFRHVYHPGNIVVAAAGQLEHAALAELIGRHFGGLEQGGNSADGGPPKAASFLLTRSKRELGQVYLCLGSRAYHQAHRDRYGTYVLNTVLGGSMSSRLFQNIREKRGLVYSIASGVAAYSDAGSLTIFAGTSLGSLDQVVGAVLDEMRRLVQEPVPAEELRRAKDHLKGSLMLSLEHTSSRMNNLARQEIYFGRQFSLDETLSGIEAVEAPDVERIARDIFSGRLAMSVLGNLEGHHLDPEQLRL